MLFYREIAMLIICMVGAINILFLAISFNVWYKHNIVKISTSFENTSCLTCETQGTNVTLSCKNDRLGVSEISQLKEYLRLIRSDNNSNLVSGILQQRVLSHKIHNISMDGCLQFIISEKIAINNQSTCGGTNFHVTVSGKQHLFVCSTTDHFNGHYHISCPVYDVCQNVSVKLLSTAFSAFYAFQQQFKSEKFLWFKEICLADFFNTFFSNVPKYENKYTGWYRENELKPWKWFFNGKGLLSNQLLLDNLSNFTVPVYFFGDSYLRGVYYYLLKLLNGFTDKLAKTKLKSSMSFRNFHYNFSGNVFPWQNSTFPSFFPNAKNLIQNLPEESKKRTSEYVIRYKTEQIVIISSGSWDVSLNGVEYFVNDVLPNLTDFLIGFNRACIRRNTKFIFLAMPACFQEITRSNYDGRNNAKIAALNRMLLDPLQLNNVTVVDYFLLSISRHQETSADGYHFPSLPNSVGETVAKIVLQEIFNV